MKAILALMKWCIEEAERELADDHTDETAREMKRLASAAMKEHAGTECNHESSDGFERYNGAQLLWCKRCGAVNDGGDGWELPGAQDG